MKTTILQAEPFDSTPSLIEKIKGCQSPRILLIFPWEFRKFPRRVDLIELNRAAKQIGAEFAIVSQNEITRELAKGLAIPVFSTIEQAEQSTWPSSSIQLNQPHQPKGFEGLLQQRDAAYPKTKEQFKNRSYIFRLILLLTVMLTAVLMLLVPSASVTVYPETKMQTVEFPVRASEEVKQVSLAGLLPAKRLSFDLTAEKSGTSTGSVDVGFTKARGIVKIHNLTPDPITLPIGTHFSTSSERDIKFSLVEDLVIPPGEGGIQGTVEAVLPGEEGNVSSGEVTFVEGTAGALLEVNNEEPFSGGQTQRLPAPTELDYLRLRAKILDELNQNALVKGASLFPYGEHSIPESLRFEEIIHEERSVPVGEISDTLMMTITARFSILGYSESDFVDLVDQVISTAIPVGYHLAENSIRIAPFTIDRLSEQGEAMWTVNASGKIVKNYSVEDLKKAIRSKRNLKAVEIIDEMLPHEFSARVTPFVSWWPWLPILTERITIVETSENAG